MKTEIEDWKEQIVRSYENESVQSFHDCIWEMSIKAFDIPREVQVVIDKTHTLFISVGSPGFVSFDGQESALNGMKLPLKEWIHTHPFGQAYFSSTDKSTVAVWNTKLDSATVLGNGEKAHWYFRCGPDGSHVMTKEVFDWQSSDYNFYENTTDVFLDVSKVVMAGLTDYQKYKKAKKEYKKAKEKFRSSYWLNEDKGDEE